VVNLYTIVFFLLLNAQGDCLITILSIEKKPTNDDNIYTIFNNKINIV